MARISRRVRDNADDQLAGDADRVRYADVFGTDGNDMLVGTSADERFRPYLSHYGSDKIDGGGGDDILLVDYSHQQISSTTYASSIFGQLTGDYQGSLYCTGSEVDFKQITRLEFYGASGPDLVQVFFSADELRIDGGAGHDELLLFFNLITADTTIIHRHGALDFMGGHFTHFEDFTVQLGSGNDYMEFGNGNDPLVGNGGDDVLNGGGGNDYLVGGSGADVVIGGHGADTFAFWHLADFATGDKLDEIKHFSRAQGDKIELQYIDADPDTPGDQAFSVIGGAAFTGLPGPYEVRFQDEGHGKVLLQIDIDHDRIADYQVIVHAPNLLPSDIVA